MGARIFDVCIRNPGKHFASLSKHLLSLGIEVGEHLNGNTGVTNQRRNCLHNLLVFLQLLAGAELVARRHQRPNFWIFSNESWIGGLPVYIADQAFYPNSLLGIAT